MKPIKFGGFNTVFAKNQKEYLPLPAHKTDSGRVTTCWKLTYRERVKLLFTGLVGVNNCRSIRRYSRKNYQLNVRGT